MREGFKEAVEHFLRVAQAVVDEHFAANFPDLGATLLLDPGVRYVRVVRRDHAPCGSPRNQVLAGHPGHPDCMEAGYAMRMACVRASRDRRFEEGRSVHCFVDSQTGDVLKARSWKGPAKGARGNVFAQPQGTALADEAALRRWLTPYGVAYLQGGSRR